MTTPDYPEHLARADLLLTPDELRQKYGSEHPKHLLTDWREEVYSGYTLRGYWSWVEAQLEEEEND